MRVYFLLFVILVQPIFSQEKEITLEDIWTNNTFATQSLEAFQSMKNGDFYTILNNNSYGTYMDKYDYKTSGTYCSGRIFNACELWRTGARDKS